MTFLIFEKVKKPLYYDHTLCFAVLKLTFKCHFVDADRQSNRKLVDADLEKITPLLTEFGATEYHIDLILDILLKEQHKLSKYHRILFNTPQLMDSYMKN